MPALVFFLLFSCSVTKAAFIEANHIELFPCVCVCVCNNTSCINNTCFVFIPLTAFNCLYVPADLFEPPVDYKTPSQQGTTREDLDCKLNMAGAGAVPAKGTKQSKWEEEKEVCVFLKEAARATLPPRATLDQVIEASTNFFTEFAINTTRIKTHLKVRRRFT